MLKVVIAALLVVGLVSVGGGSSASAQAVVVQDDKVTICHRTNSVTNPYVEITVDEDAVDGQAGKSKGQPDHYGEHKGPVATSEEVAQGYKDDKIEWGDIIPPVPGYHEGLNWTEEGQAIYNNGCNFEGEDSDPVVASASVTIVPATCESGDILVYGDIEYATFSGTADGTEGPDTYSVVATAGEGAVFVDGETLSSELVLEGDLDGPLTGDDCVLSEETPDPEVLPNTSGTTGGIALISAVVALLATGFGVRRLLSKEI